MARLASLTNDLAGTASDLTVGPLAYNPASQIVSQTRSNDAYAYAGLANVNRDYTSNGLNQYLTAGSAGLTHDANGNLTGDGASTFGYSSENLLTSATVSGVATTLAYDPLLRLAQTSSSTATANLAYDGLDLIAEYDAAGTLQRRYVHGPGADEPILWYEGAGTTDRRFLSSDERGSVISLSDSAGALIGIDSYDEYGLPAAANLGRFQYTGQTWLPEVGAYYYKARFYSPTLGRFLQTDPIGYEDSPNLYAYVLNDPVNNVDPLGLDIIVVGQLPPPANGGFTLGSGVSLGTLGITGSGGAGDVPGGAAYFQTTANSNDKPTVEDEIVVFGRRVSKDSILVEAAEAAANSIPRFFDTILGRTAFGWLRGILIHNKFAKIIREMNSPMYNSEVSYLRGKVVDYGTPGSSRVDAVVGNLASPLFAIDLKTGGAFISSSQLEAYRVNLPPGALLQELIVP